MTHTVRLFAAAADAAGVEATTSEAATLEALRGELAAEFGAEFTAILAQCSLLVNGQRMDAGELPAASTIDVLPPFAGG